MSIGLVVLASLWVVVVLDPHWWLAGQGLTILLRAPIVLFVGLVPVLLFELLTVKGVARRWTWYWPLLIFTGIMLVSVPGTINAGLARVGVQNTFFWWIMIVATAALIDSARRAELLVLGYGLHFLVWTLWGTTTGLVPWHPTLANFDSYGAWMVIGAGMCSYLVVATDDKRLSRIFMATVVLAAVGVVASMARGAFLAALAVGGVTWLRSPRKGAALGAVFAGGIVFVIAASLLHGAAYWEEMATILEGTEEATGEDRWEMWKAAWGVFLTHPFFGVGFDNWGIFASQYYRPGDLGGPYVDNPSMLWGKSTHNIYVQVLAEHGLFGIGVYLWIFVDFWKRNTYMRTPTAVRKWAAMGGRLRLDYVALAVEAAMIGWMASAALYSMAGKHWVYTILALNLMLYMLVKTTRVPPSAAVTASPGRRVRTTAPRPRVGTPAG